MNFNVETMVHLQCVYMYIFVIGIKLKNEFISPSESHLYRYPQRNTKAKV